MSIAHHVLPSAAAGMRRPYLTGGGLVALLTLAHAATDAVTGAVGALLPSIHLSLAGAGGTIGVAFGPLIVLVMVAWTGPATTPWLMIPGLLLGTMALLLIPPSNISP